jgi:hypothetical protein
MICPKVTPPFLAHHCIEGWLIWMSLISDSVIQFTLIWMRWPESGGGTYFEESRQKPWIDLEVSARALTWRQSMALTSLSTGWCRSLYYLSYKSASRVFGKPIDVGPCDRLQNPYRQCFIARFNRGMSSRPRRVSFFLSLILVSIGALSSTPPLIPRTASTVLKEMRSSSPRIRRSHSSHNVKECTKLII